MSSHRFRAPLLAACGLAVGLAAPASRAAAQQEVEVTPFFTSYYALAKLASTTNNEGSLLTQRQANAAGLGARLAYTLPGSMAVEGSLAYVWSGTRLDVEDQTGDPNAWSGSVGTGGNLMYVSGRVRYMPRRSNLYLLAGAGLVKRGGDAWDMGDADTKLTSKMGVLGAGVRAPVTPTFALDISAEVNLYSTDPDAEGETYRGKFQQDILITIGVPIRLGNR